MGTPCGVIFEDATTNGARETGISEASTTTFTYSLSKQLYRRLASVVPSFVQQISTPFISRVYPVNPWIKDRAPKSGGEKKRDLFESFETLSRLSFPMIFEENDIKREEYNISKQ